MSGPVPRIGASIDSAIDVHPGRWEENTMIQSGTVLIQTDAARPDCFQAGEEECPSAWTSLRNTLGPLELEAELSRTGWTFFYLANRLRSTAFGFDPVKRLAGALRSIVGSVRQQGCNSVQIDAVETRSFLGLPYVTVSAHPRHVQKGMVFVAT
jgi:hypothetical protein